MRAVCRRWPVVVVPLLLVAVGLYAQNLTLAEWDQVAGYQSPYAAELPPAPATAPLTPQVVLAVVDGLRQDTSEGLPFLNELRARGASRVAVTGQPSLSLPAVATFGMGTEPEIHGVTTNWYEGPARLDNLFASAGRRGLKAAVVDGEDWVQLYGKDIPIQRVFATEAGGADDTVLQAALEVLEREKPALLVVHFSSLDTAGHDYGAGSPQYAETAAAIDSRLRELAGGLDLSQATLIVASDHGHVLSGGHGGWEPEVIQAPVVLAGKGIKPGNPPPARQADVSPTIAALLGVGTPASATGRAWLEVLDAAERDLMVKALVQARVRLNFAGAYLETLGARRTADALAEAWDELLRLEALGGSVNPPAWHSALLGAEALDAQLSRTIHAGRAEKVARSRWQRLPLAAVAVAIPAAVFALLRRRQRYFGPALIWGAASLALFTAVFYVHGFRFSLSAFNSESQIQAFFTARLVESAVVSLVSAVGLGLTVGLMACRRGEAGRGQALGWQAAGAAATATAFAVYLLFAQTVVFYDAFGLRFQGLLPSLGWGLKFYLDLLQATAVGVSAPLAPLLAAGVAWAAGRLGGGARAGGPAAAPVGGPAGGRRVR